ncbi:MAG: WxcM-like domain-containing protein [Muribaculaceae bacterium]|nr:WxcM-like domain-containing protein [Muribaculaceae bacterium]
MEKFTEPCIIDLPRIYDPRGNLSFLQNGDYFLPFKIERVYWIYDVPAGAERGSHCHLKSQGLLVAVSGSFNVSLFDGKKTLTFTLNRPYQGLYIPPGYWRTIDNFSTGSVCMALASTLYSEDDYVRDFDEFVKMVADK